MSADKKSSRTAARWILMVVIPAIAIVVGGYIYLSGGRYVETDNAYVKADKVQISPEISGQVIEVLVHENQHVKAGQVLYRLDPAPYKIAVAKAKASLAQVETDLAELKASYHKTEAMIQLASTHLDFTDKEVKRQVALLDKHYTSDSDFDDAEQSKELAIIGVAVQKAELKRIAASLGGSVDTPVEAHPDYLAALSVLEQAQLDLAHTEIKAPLEGEINMPPKPGQFLNPGQASMTLVASGDLWIEANFTEKELTYVREGQGVEVNVDIYPGVTWHGTVESLSPATSSEFSVLPAQNATGNWVKVAQRVPVRIKLELDSQLPTLRTGLSAIPEIDTHHTRSLFGITL